jgi:hypothetical protein
MRRPTKLQPRHVPRRLGPLLPVSAMLVLAAMVLGTGGLVPRPPGRPWAAPARGGPYLVISEQNLRDIRAVAPKLAATLLARRTTIVLSPGKAALTGGRAAVGTAFFTSYAHFLGVLRRHAIPAGVRAVAYDPELWQATPLPERLSPGHYMALFAAAARRHGYAVILMPGRDLLAMARSCRQRPWEDLDAAFLRCGLAGESARLSEVFEIQTAPVETRATEMRSFAAACAKQARAANPAVVLIATLSTQPGTGRVSGGQLARAAAAVRPYVQGFQLNMTRRSTRTAVAFLRTISAFRG